MSITLRSVPHSLPDELSSAGRNLAVALDSLNAVLATRWYHYVPVPVSRYEHLHGGLI